MHVEAGEEGGGVRLGAGRAQRPAVDRRVPAGVRQRRREVAHHLGRPAAGIEEESHRGPLRHGRVTAPSSQARVSSSSRTRPRNAAAYAPSNARWSKLSVSRPTRMHRDAGATVPLDDDRPGHDPVGGEDGHLGLADDRHGDGSAVRAGIRDRERSAADVVGGELAGSGPFRGSGDRGGHLGEVELGGVTDDGHDQPLEVEVDGDAEMDVAVHHELVVPRGRVDAGKSAMASTTARATNGRNVRPGWAARTRATASKSTSMTIAACGDVAFDSIMCLAIRARTGVNGTISSSAAAGASCSSGSRRTRWSRVRRGGRSRQGSTRVASSAMLPTVSSGRRAATPEAEWRGMKLRERRSERRNGHNGVSLDEAVTDFRLACISRAIDDREITLRQQSQVFFQISGAGHEALLLGLARSLRAGYDWFFPYYRDRAAHARPRHHAHRHALAGGGIGRRPRVGGTADAVPLGRPRPARRHPEQPDRQPVPARGRLRRSGALHRPARPSRLFGPRRRGDVRVAGRGRVLRGRVLGEPQHRRPPRAAGALRRRRQRLRDLGAGGRPGAGADLRDGASGSAACTSPSSTGATTSRPGAGARRRSSACGPGRDPG